MPTTSSGCASNEKTRLSPHEALFERGPIPRGSAGSFKSFCVADTLAASHLSFHFRLSRIVQPDTVHDFPGRRRVEFKANGCGPAPQEFRPNFISELSVPVLGDIPAYNTPHRGCEDEVLHRTLTAKFSNYRHVLQSGLVDSIVGDLVKIDNARKFTPLAMTSYVQLESLVLETGHLHPLKPPREHCQNFRV